MLEVGNVLVRRGAHAPFIITHIWILSTDPERFEIDERENIDRFGNLTKSERRIRSSNLSMYNFVSSKFMDERYVKWATHERGGMFMLKKPESAPEPKKPYVKQIDISKAVFYRQNRILNPGITVEEVERLWNENYFPLYSQVCFELNEALGKAGSLTPLNYEAPNPPTPASDKYKAGVTKARPYVVPVAPPPPDEGFTLRPSMLKEVENLLDLHNSTGEDRRLRLKYFRDALNGLLEGINGACLTEDDLKHVGGSVTSKSHIIVVRMRYDGVLFILGDLSQYWMPLEALPKYEVEPDFNLPAILDSGHIVTFGKYQISCQVIIDVINAYAKE
jgi:hypothetical protein